MKTNTLLAQSVLCAVTLLLVVFAAVAQEPSPREQFQTTVVAYQKTANSQNALKIIKLFKQLEPPPAVPEEAREPFVMGGTVLKKASNPAQAGKAVDLFTQSLNVAPWFADAYYNRALARETAGQFNEAMDDLKLYIEFKLTESERREAQDKIYSLKAEAQLAATKKTEEDKVAAAHRRAEIENARLPGFEGIWKNTDDNFAGAENNSAIELIEDSPSHWRVNSWKLEYKKYVPRPAADPIAVFEVKNVQIIGRQLSFRALSPLAPYFSLPMGSMYFDYSLTLAEDGSRLTGYWVWTGGGRCGERGRVPVVFIR